MNINQMKELPNGRPFGPLAAMAAGTMEYASATWNTTILTSQEGRTYLKLSRTDPSQPKGHTYVCRFLDITEA